MFDSGGLSTLAKNNRVVIVPIVQIRSEPQKPPLRGRFCLFAKMRVWGPVRMSLWYGDRISIGISTCM